VLSSAIPSSGSRLGIVRRLRWERVRRLRCQVKAIRKSRQSHIQPKALMAIAPTVNPVVVSGCSGTIRPRPEWSSDERIDVVSMVGSGTS
jgi:hypothetical protein